MLVSISNQVIHIYFPGLYYGTSICLVTFASGLSVVTLNIYHRGVRGTPVPKVFKSLILDRLGRLIFMQFDTVNHHRNSKVQVSLSNENSLSLLVNIVGEYF